MKKIILLMIVILLFADFAFAQIKRDRHKRSDSKIEKLEKIKLIEALEMDEETTLRFFSRRAEHRQLMQSLQQDAEGIMIELEKALQSDKITDAELKTLMDDYLVSEKNMISQRNLFLNSLNDLLTTEQIARLIIFEKKFKQELRDVIIRERQKRKN